MAYKEIYRESNEETAERLALVFARTAEIEKEAKEELPAPFGDYFVKQAAFLGLVKEILRQEAAGELEHRSMEQCEEWNERLFSDINEPGYEESYLNPAYAGKVLGEELGALLCFLASELRSLIPLAFQGRRGNITVFLELFVEIYGLFAEGLPEKKELEQTIYWFYHDYSEIFSEDSVRNMVDPEADYFTEIVTKAELKDLRYLYRYGSYIGDNERKLAEFLNSLPEEKIQAMADTYTEGYRIGFEITGKDLSKKKTVSVEYPIGFERVVRAAVSNFKEMGLAPVIYREAAFSFDGLGKGKRSVYTKSLNRQYEYDHKNDKAFYLDKAFVERRLETLKLAFEKYKEKAGELAGPAVIETFGEEDFTPVNKSYAPRYTEKQNSLNVYYASQAGQITNRYIPGEERSFTIIAYPLPSIGEKFEEIFAETVKLNTLDYMRYRNMQQKLIDVLDTGVAAHVTGKGDNRTDLTISFYPLKNKDKETVFENCVADVNIPVGEVFTSPVLKGTTGLLHVSKVYLNGLMYKNLVITFEDGMIRDYTCENFATEEENRAYIYENVLMQHDTLPMGEFAIGTNTTAYKMARDYDIADKLPILIAEKTGPHFAVGDTCYSHAEDTAVYNPDGKEIVARDNDISLNRKTDIDKAYFNCHTDITIPYDELDCITVIREDGSTEDIIRNGHFTVPGTEELNEPLMEA